MEDFDILNKFDNDKLIDVVKNYKRYGYDDELRDYAINLLGERGWNREDLQQFGYLTNHDYDEAEKQWSNLAFGIGMVVVPLIYPFGLRIRRAVILSPEVFSTILIIGGVLLLIMTFFDIPKNFDLYSAN